MENRAVLAKIKPKGQNDGFSVDKQVVLRLLTIRLPRPMESEHGEQTIQTPNMRYIPL